MGTLGDLGAGCCGLIEGTGVRRGGLELYCFGSGVLAVSQPVQMNRDLYHTTLISHLTRVPSGNANNACESSISLGIRVSVRR